MFNNSFDCHQYITNTFVRVSVNTLKIHPNNIFILLSIPALITGHNHNHSFYPDVHYDNGMRKRDDNT